MNFQPLDHHIFPFFVSLTTCSSYIEIDVKFQLSGSQVLLVAIWIMGKKLTVSTFLLGMISLDVATRTISLYFSV